MKFAAKTTVNPQKTRQEIEATLSRYGATAFMYATEGDKALIQFKIKNWLIRYVFSLPTKREFAPSRNMNRLCARNGARCY